MISIRLFPCKMADPLSITASVIAVVTAAEGVSKTLSKIRRANRAPSEFLALMNEVSDFRVVLDNLDSYVRSVSSESPSSRTLQHLMGLLQRGKDTLLQLDGLVHYQLAKPSSTTEHPKVSRLEWVKGKRVIEEYRQKLRDIRLNIVAQMATLNA